ncbi:hypothetical protein EX30DRAFT_373124 [Ascodesmis nigricans]|uniref:Uncharacterized protein n=1 Tax=Ascodesmis nigricans TaxID=341454 RepID=A0A4S2MS81_9PEZI|nr:hypothetical protein EX30DRAFT_373124 [Ascodesmis nigricans]
MPIKFPKFTRRKSAGNELEANYEPANLKSPDEPSSGGSFHVLPRGNRGSAQTNSTYSYHGSHSSSNRLSSNSTLPSTDAPITPDEYRQPHLPDLGSFHLHKPSLHKAHSSGPGLLLDDPRAGRPAPPRRTTMTLATPPQLASPALDTSSLFDEDMFEHLGSRSHDGANDRNGFGSITPKAPKIASNSALSSSGSGDRPTSSGALQITATPYSNIFTSSQHMDSDRPTINTESSPYHWDNNPSPSDPTKSLLHVDPNDNSPRNSRMLTPGQKQRQFSHTRTDSLEAPAGRAMPKVRRGSGDAGMKRTSAVHQRPSMPVEDEDAAIVARSSHSPRIQHLNVHKDKDSGWGETSSSDNSIRSAGSSKDTAFTTPLISRGNTDPSIKKGVGASSSSTPKVKRYALSDEGSSTEVDVDISAAAALAVQYEEKGSIPDIIPSKVMTGAQFERYRQQQDEKRQLSGKNNDSDDESVVSDEEESDTERNRAAQKLRERQDAHLSVYRQQMRKVTGTTQPAALPPMQRASVSMSALPMLNGAGTPAADNSDDEDEEIPLGILMAHGFPNKARPPTRLANSSSQPNLRAAAQRDANLPVFARNLPADPYNVGAGLVNPAERMPMAFNQRPESVAGSVYGAVPPYQPQNRMPAGLVGKIMEAEEQRAARRGMPVYSVPSDPFKATPDPFSRQPTGGHGLLGLGGNGRQSIMPGSNPMASPTMDPNSAMQMQFQMQQQQQMQQMMMQMQFMQMQMGNQGPMMNPSMLNPGFMNPGMNPGMAGGSGGMRAMSMIGTPGMMNPSGGGGAPSIRGAPAMGVPPRTGMSSSTLGVPSMPQRPYSMVDPHFAPGAHTSYAPSIAVPRPGSIAGFGIQPGYTPSIAPSERSNIGLPGRYRPVSYAPPANNGARTSTLTSRINGPSRLATVNDDDDDETGWEELNKKREEKKRRKKSFFGLGGGEKEGV